MEMKRMLEMNISSSESTKWLETYVANTPCNSALFVGS